MVGDNQDGDLGVSSTMKTSNSSNSNNIEKETGTCLLCTHLRLHGDAQSV